ncbi:MAG: hypothetical protein ACLU80_12360 [Dorea sp.]
MTIEISLLLSGVSVAFAIFSVSAQSREMRKGHTGRCGTESNNRHDGDGET